MDGVLVIDTPELVDVVYDPLRARILRHLSTPMSVKQLAAGLSTTPGRLYYHVHLLEEHGLVEIADQQLSRTKLERVYLAVYHSFRLSKDLQGSARAGTNGLVIGFLEDIVEEYVETLATHESRGQEWVVNRHKRLSPARSLEFAERMHTLIDEFFGTDVPDDADGVVHGQLWVMTPFDALPPSAESIARITADDPDVLRRALANLRRPEPSAQ